LNFGSGRLRFSLRTKMLQPLFPLLWEGSGNDTVPITPVLSTGPPEQQRDALALPLSPEYDCTLQGAPEAVGAEVVRNLFMKGYCKIQTGLDDGALRAGVTDIKKLDRGATFKAPSDLLIEGLLGPEGSTEIAELALPELEQNGQGIDALDGRMSHVAGMISRHLGPELGFTCTDRSASIVHKAGEPSSQTPDAMTENEACKWLHLFMRHRIMCLLFLNPRGGVLELQPFDEVSETEAIDVKPGMMVLLRADALSHKYTSPAADFVMSCWFLHPDRSGVRTAQSDGRDGIPTVPAAQRLVQYASERIVLMKGEQEKNLRPDDKYPRGWQLMASHDVVKDVQIALGGIAVNLPNNNDFIGKMTVSMTAGADFGICIPYQRWDYQQVYPRYNPDPECWRHDRFATSIKHATFIEGYHLFDNKFFSMSILEGKVMDPNQRVTLESAYEALHDAGYSKKQLMQAFIGVYEGHTASDWDKIEHETAGACAGSYSPTIASNRLSFALGMMGPSFTIDTEGSSSLAAIYQACHDLRPSLLFKKPLVVAGLAGGTFLHFSPYWWPVHNGFMNPLGRSLTFDDQAGGYIKGEGVSQAVMRRHGEMVEGKLVFDDNKMKHGILSGYSSNNSGRSASLTAPSSFAQQQAIGDCLHMSRISQLDVDAFECDGKGNLLNDAVELSTLVRVLRSGTGGDKETLSVTSCKPSMGYCQESAGIASFMAVIASFKLAAHMPNIHLRQLNPHVDVEGAGVNVLTEHLSWRMRSSYSGVAAQGFGGTNVAVLIWGALPESTYPVVRPALNRQVFTFWPGGGGELEDEAKPGRGYSIIGSWGAWEKPQAMKLEDDGVYGCVVTLGDNRFEQFQIWIDGDSKRVLHPGMSKGAAGSPLFGPHRLDDVQHKNWMIDGRAQTIAVPALMDGQQDSSSSTSYDFYQVGTRDLGVQGDQYHVKLLVAGKWRTVTWDRVTTSARAQPSDAALVRGIYYIASSWNNWQFDLMQHDDSNPGTHYIDVELPFFAAHFQIVRNKDWSQAFFPQDLRAGADGPVAGPRGDGKGKNWTIDGRPNERIRIEFQRACVGDQDARKVSWRAAPKALT